ncbi:hypothetical protein ACTFIW_000022 [Dictyostelium discoideum]
MFTIYIDRLKSGEELYEKIQKDRIMQRSLKTSAHVQNSCGWYKGRQVVQVEKSGSATYKPSIMWLYRPLFMERGVDIAGSEVSERQLAEELQLNLEKVSAPFLIYYTDSTPLFHRVSPMSIGQRQLQMDDIPKSAVRAKRDSTLFALLDDHVQGIPQACITSTNTGALVLDAAYILGRMPAVQKTPLMAEIPFAQRVIPAVLLDSGISKG